MAPLFIYYKLIYFHLSCIYNKTLTAKFLENVASEILLVAGVSWAANKESLNVSNLQIFISQNV